MARKLYYHIPDDSNNQISDHEWEDVLRLQHWYNSEFIWTAGKLTLKMFAVFQNPEALEGDEEHLWLKVSERRKDLRKRGFMENEIVRMLEREGLIIAKYGGYTDHALASGFTRVANNEWNAYLVCEFLLKVSTLLPGCTIHLRDEGAFIKPREIRLRDGEVWVKPADEGERSRFQTIITNKRVFSTVDPSKYDNFPVYKTTLSEFNELERDEQNKIVGDWNWLGFDQNFDRDGDDIRGEDLNQKVKKFQLIPASGGQE